MVDRFGAPNSDVLGVIERHRLIDGKTAREGKRSQ